MPLPRRSPVMISGAHENGSQAPSAVEVSRVQEKDLPRRLRLHFANFEHDHEPSEQSASRITTEAIDELDVEIPISMTPDTAAQLADDHPLRPMGGPQHAIASRSTTVGSRWSPPTASRYRSTGRPSACASSRSITRSAVLSRSTPSGTTTAPTSRPSVATPSFPSGGVPGGAGSGPDLPVGHRHARHSAPAQRRHRCRLLRCDLRPLRKLGVCRAVPLLRRRGDVRSCHPHQRRDDGRRDRSNYRPADRPDAARRLTGLRRIEFDHCHAL